MKSDSLIQHTVTIPVYKKTDDKFIVSSENKYTINYVRGKHNNFRIVVNNFLTSQVINIKIAGLKYKSSVLWAISEYVHGSKTEDNSLQLLKFSDVGSFAGSKAHKRLIIDNINGHLITISKEVRRDNLTHFKLINNYSPESVTETEKPSFIKNILTRFLSSVG